MGMMEEGDGEASEEKSLVGQRGRRAPRERTGRAEGRTC